MRRDVYSRRDEVPSVDGVLDAPPKFDLTYLFNSRDHRTAEPEEVTILPQTGLGSNYTEWITADVDAAIDIREVA